MIRPASLTLLAIALLSAMPAAAQIYSWRDKDGKLHYSDQPPPRGDVKVIGGQRRPTPPAVAEESEGEPQGEAGGQNGNGNGNGEAQAGAKPATQPPQPAADQPKSIAEQDQAFRQRRAEAAEAQAKADKQAAEDARRARYCEQARSQLAGLQSGQRFARLNSAGERVVLDDAARADEIARTQSQVDEFCR